MLNGFQEVNIKYVDGLCLPLYACLNMRISQGTYNSEDTPYEIHHFQGFVQPSDICS